MRLFYIKVESVTDDFMFHKCREMYTTPNVEMGSGWI